MLSSIQNHPEDVQLQISFQHQLSQQSVDTESVMLTSIFMLIFLEMMRDLYLNELSHPPIVRECEIKSNQIKYESNRSLSFLLLSGVIVSPSLSQTHATFEAKGHWPCL